MPGIRRDRAWFDELGDASGGAEATVSQRAAGASAASSRFIQHELGPWPRSKYMRLLSDTDLVPIVERAVFKRSSTMRVYAHSFILFNAFSISIDMIKHVVAQELTL